MSHRIFTPFVFLLVHSLMTAEMALSAEEQLMDGIAAQVGGQIVLVSEVSEMTRPMEARLRAGGAPEAQIRQMHKEALDRLIEEKLITTMVVRLEMGASQDEIDNAIASIAQNNGLSPEQLKASVANHGLTLNEYRAKLKGEIERSKIINAMVSDRVKVEPEEVEELFQQRFGNQKKGGKEVRLRHILVAVGGPSNRDEKTACALLEEAAVKINAGQLDFNEAARQLTNMNPEQQGELGWMHTSEIAPWMSGSIATLKPGEISEPIPMSFGCNLLQVVNFRSFTPVTLEQAQGPLRSELINQRTDREIMAWLDSIREQTFISRKGRFAEGASANP